MEGSTGELLVDAEDLMLDTKKRLESCSDAYTSFEIVEEDLIFVPSQISNVFFSLWKRDHQKTLIFSPRFNWIFHFN